MNIENDPRMTAYALGELGGAEQRIFEQELANAGGAGDAVREIRFCAGRIRQAFAAEPVYAMTDEQRSVLLADAGAGAPPVMVEESEFQHSDKILPWVTQPVISEVDKRKIAEALKPSPWRSALPLLGSVAVAAGFVWLATLVLMQERPDVAATPSGADGGRDPQPVWLAPAGAFSMEDWQKRRAAEGLPEIAFLYGTPIPLEDAPPDLLVERQWLVRSGLLDPVFEEFRRALFPVHLDTDSYDTVRQFMLADMLPPADQVRVDELVNAFEYDYSTPGGGETFTVDTELASCPWDPDRQLLQIGVRAAEGESEQTVAEAVHMAVEFNPATVAAYRLLGQPEVEQPVPPGGGPGGASVTAGHTVTALYEVVPREGRQAPEELGTVRVDYKEAGGTEEQSVQATVAEVKDSGSWREASDDLRFAASLVGYGMLLEEEEGKPSATSEFVLELARDAIGKDPDGRREEFVGWIEKTIELKNEAQK